MSNEKRDLLKPSTKDDRRDYNFMRDMSIMSTDALIDSAPWHERLPWQIWKRTGWGRKHFWG